MERDADRANRRQLPWGAGGGVSRGCVACCLLDLLNPLAAMLSVGKRGAVSEHRVVDVTRLLRGEVDGLTGRHSFPDRGVETSRATTVIGLVEQAALGNAFRVLVAELFLVVILEDLGLVTAAGIEQMAEHRGRHDRVKAITKSIGSELGQLPGLNDTGVVAAFTGEDPLIRRDRIGLVLLEQRRTRLGASADD